MLKFEQSIKQKTYYGAGDVIRTHDPLPGNYRGNLPNVGNGKSPFQYPDLVALLLPNFD